MNIKTKLRKARYLTRLWAKGEWVVFPDLGEWQDKIIKNKSNESQELIRWATIFFPKKGRK